VRNLSVVYSQDRRGMLRRAARLGMSALSVSREIERGPWAREQNYGEK
jgi:hypothetical protein